MIKLNRLGGEPFLLNAELIRYVEARPDTFITLTSGDRVIVQQSMDEVMGLVIDYQQRKQLVPPPLSRSSARQTSRSRARTQSATYDATATFETGVV